MDLIYLVLGLALIGFVLYLITKYIPMDPMFRMAIYVLVFIVLLLFILHKFGKSIPNVMSATEAYAQTPSAFTDPMCDAKTFTVTYKPKDCPKGVGKTTGKLNVVKGTRTVTLTCLS